jgi:hypothetical protein
MVMLNKRTSGSNRKVAKKRRIQRVVCDKSDGKEGPEEESQKSEEIVDL